MAPFGTVYLAQHLYLKQRTAVIKVLHAVHLGSDQEKEQFLQEAQILETLKGLSYILPLLDVGIDGDVPYMVAEYAEQGSLRMRMQQRGVPLSLQETLMIIQHIGQGLQAAHNKGIVHRDLKPENILFNAKGEALLADFGISTVLSTASVKYTQVVGTPAYMAPEQFRGEIRKESDQYALACIAYELLTGRKLFEAPDFVSMGFLHVSEAPTSPRQFNPQIPEAVERAILKALSKQRTERYPNVLAFVGALNARNDQPLPRTQYVEPQPGKQPINSPYSQTSLPPGGAMIQHGYNRYANYDEAAIKAQTDAHLILGWMRFVTMLFYIVPVVSWIIYFIAGKRNIFLRFHYLQAVLGWLIWLIIFIISATLYSIDSSSISETVSVLVFILWPVLLITAALASLVGKFFSIRILGQWAKRFAYKVA